MRGEIKMSLSRNDFEYILELMNKETIRLDNRMKRMMESDSSYNEYKETVDNLNCVKKLVEKIKKEYII